MDKAPNLRGGQTWCHIKDDYQVKIDFRKKVATNDTDFSYVLAYTRLDNQEQYFSWITDFLEEFYRVS